MYTAYVDDELLYSPMLAHDGYSILGPVLTWELNKIPTLRFKIPPTNERYEDLKQLSSIITFKDGQNVIFRGRILEDKGDFYKTRDIYCEGDLAFLLDTTVEPYTYSGTLSGLFGQLISAHNARADTYKQFAVGSVTVKASIESGDKTVEVLRMGSSGDAVKKMQQGLLTLGYTLPIYGADGVFGAETETAVKAFQHDKGLTENGIYDSATQNAMIRALNAAGQYVDSMEVSTSDCLSTFEEIKQRMIDVYGGYLSTRHVYENGALVTYIDYLGSSGEINPETIEFGENLLSLSKFIDAKNVYTVILAEGKEKSKPKDGEINRTRVTEVNNNSPYVVSDSGVSLFGRIEKHIVWGDIDSPQTLLDTAKDDLSKNIEANLTIEIQAAVLHLLNVNTGRLILGGYNHTVSPPHNLDAYLQCSRMVLYPESIENTKFTFGNVPMRLTGADRTHTMEKFASRETMLSLMDRVTALETPT